MSKRKNLWRKINWQLIVVLAASSLPLLLASTPAHAGCPAANLTIDTDNDGFSDQLECAGVTLLSGEQVPFCGTGTGTHGCMHPDIPDIFVVIERATDSLIPAIDPLKYLTLVTPHEIDRNDVGTLLDIPGTDPIQRALLISENKTPGAGGGYLGELPWGVPPNISMGTIYTQDIVDYVSSKGGTAAHAEEYIRYVLGHEFGHGMRLAPKYNSRYNGYHYSTRDNVVMQENAVVSTKGGSAPTFYFPADWGVDSEAAYKLK